MSGGIKAAFELAQEGEQGPLLVVVQCGHRSGDLADVPLHGSFANLPARAGEVDAIGPTLLLPPEQAIALERVEQLADVALGDEQGVGKLLLGRALVQPGVVDDIESADGEAQLAEPIARLAVNPVKDTHEPYPGSHREWQFMTALRGR